MCEGTFTNLNEFKSSRSDDQEVHTGWPDCNNWGVREFYKEIIHLYCT